MASFDERKVLESLDQKESCTGDNWVAEIFFAQRTKQRDLLLEIESAYIDLLKVIRGETVNFCMKCSVARCYEKGT